MKEILNNAKEISNNKLNLPSILTKKKIVSLFLFAMLNSQPTKAGLQFSECLNGGVFNNPYDSIVNFVNISDVADKQVFCCEDKHPFSCSPLSSPCPYPTYFQ